MGVGWICRHDRALGHRLWAVPLRLAGQEVGKVRSGQGTKGVGGWD